MKHILFVALIVASHVVVSGCTEKGDLESAGERADEMIENIKEGESPLHKKGTGEKVGEKIDETVESITK